MQVRAFEKNIPLSVIAFFKGGIKLCVCVCVCVKERKESSSEIGRVYSTVSSYQIRVKRYFNS